MAVTYSILTKSTTVDRKAASVPLLHEMHTIPTFTHCRKPTLGITLVSHENKSTGLKNEVHNTAQ
jgi:hypothetical protein